MSLVNVTEHHSSYDSCLVHDVCVMTWFVIVDSVQLQIEEITRRLQTGEFGIPPIGERFVSVSILCTSHHW